MVQTNHEYDGFYNYKFMHKIKEGKIEYSETKLILPQKYIDIINNRYAPLNNFIFNGDIEGFLDIILPKTEEPTPEVEVTDEVSKVKNPFLIKK